ncbi:hypothetical protein Adt_17269 [Abeliophyllum distichum]|uniref:Uncharacterized protein n=1 Tax=Abeliophyllum distichum TaxID=126358 RepID=A0ABD1TG18_9LAMI
MTCSICGLSGHNKRYHDENASCSQSKLQPRRSNTSAGSQTDAREQAEFQFTPTQCNIPQRDIGPEAALPGNNLRTTVSFDNIVEDLQLIENEEQSRMETRKAKDRSVLRDSICFHAPRKRKSD